MNRSDLRGSCTWLIIVFVAIAVLVGGLIWVDILDAYYR
jgi:hypothetical protein